MNALGDICKETVAIVLATHYDPHWVMMACKWVLAHVALAIVAVRSKL